METEPDESSLRPTRRDPSSPDDPDPVPDDEGSEPAPVLPPVVAVVVTDGGIGLEATLASLLDQEYPSLSTLVVDRGAADDLTRRVAEVSPHAYVRRLARPRLFTEACNIAFGS